MAIALSMNAAAGLPGQRHSETAAHPAARAGRVQVDSYAASRHAIANSAGAPPPNSTVAGAEIGGQVGGLASSAGVGAWLVFKGLKRVAAPALGFFGRALSAVGLGSAVIHAAKDGQALLHDVETPVDRGDIAVDGAKLASDALLAGGSAAWLLGTGGSGPMIAVGASMLLSAVARIPTLVKTIKTLVSG